jgi:hypothetical protein
MKSINDPILGRLKPCFQTDRFCGWTGKVIVGSFTKPVEFSIFSRDGNTEIADDRRRAFKQFVRCHKYYKTATLQSIYKMLKKYSKDFSIDEFEELQNVFNKITSAQKVEKYVSQPHLYLLSAKKETLRLGLGFWDWFFDDEHNVGVRFEDKKAVIVGPIWVAQDAGPGYKVPKS